MLQVHAQVHRPRRQVRSSMSPTTPSSSSVSSFQNPRSVSSDGRVLDVNDRRGADASCNLRAPDQCAECRRLKRKVRPTGCISSMILISLRLLTLPPPTAVRSSTPVQRLHQALQDLLIPTRRASSDEPKVSRPGPGGGYSCYGYRFTTTSFPRNSGRSGTSPR
jgi:hypothetical protein